MHDPRNVDTAPVLIDGSWRQARSNSTFTTSNPRLGTRLGAYPISEWGDIEVALAAGTKAYSLIAKQPDRVAQFLDALAAGLEEDADALAAVAADETALPLRPRLRDIELTRTVGQLRQAATVTRDRSWIEPCLSPSAGIASYLAPIPGVAIILGPNNFPFAFNSVGGGDFAAAVATGHPVLAKANRGHPETTRRLAEHARLAAVSSGLPPATVQLVYGLDRADGIRLVSDRRVAATAFTGSKAAGLRLKSAADSAGRPIYLEMSSVNPVIVLPGALRERSVSIGDELAASILSGSGQFCTSPGLLFVPGGELGLGFRDDLIAALDRSDGATLLGPGVRQGLEHAVDALVGAGAAIVYKSHSLGEGVSYPTTLLSVAGRLFAETPVGLQVEAFGNAALLVTYDDIDELTGLLSTIEGSLTGTIFASSDGQDDVAYQAVEPVLRERVGRLLNDKTPTGVAVVPSMVHGGPYPATGHPGFTAVGVPASLRRFAMLQAFDNVADSRLPPELQAANPLKLQRLIDGRWTTKAVEP
jgi:alpha-ketoglutaric semialdehyde dehydrogenase